MHEVQIIIDKILSNSLLRLGVDCGNGAGRPYFDLENGKRFITSQYELTLYEDINSLYLMVNERVSNAYGAKVIAARNPNVSLPIFSLPQLLRRMYGTNFSSGTGGIGD